MTTTAESLKVWDRLIADAAHGRQSPTEQPELFGPTMLERSVPGKCCQCGATIPLSVLRCPEHHIAYLCSIARAA